MKEQEIIDMHGDEFFASFEKWMEGQTVGQNDDETTNFYEWDVDTFVTQYNSNFKL